MRLQQAVIAASFLGLGGVIGTMVNRPSEAQQPAGNPPAGAGAVGRFQMRVGVGTDARVIVTDTTTGQSWSHLPTGGPSWIDFGVPSGSSRR
jgi:hypothetical protein